MYLFSIDPTLHLFDTFAAFTKEFDLRADDMIFTESVLYNGYIKDLNLPCHILIRDDYETGEPSEDAIDRMLLDLQRVSFNRMIAVGGGSIMDTAKVLVLKDAYPFAQFIGKTTPNEAAHELINIPTTCGTGAELSAGGIYFYKSTGEKSGIRGPGVDHAVLIPQLIESLPFHIFFQSTMDALCHAVEGYLIDESHSNEFLCAFGREAITLILNAHADLCVHGIDYRKECSRTYLIASSLGNLALTGNGANLIHGLAYPVAEKFHIPHGESVYQFLIPTLKLYQRENPNGKRLNELISFIKPALERAGFPAENDNVFDQLEKMLNSLCPLRTMSEVGMTEADIAPFSRNIIETKQRLWIRCYIPYEEAYAAELYSARL